LQENTFVYERIISIYKTLSFSKT